MIRVQDKGNADDERLIGYLRAISAKSVVQSLKESEKEDRCEGNRCVVVGFS
eukprot:Skav215462  [mRNA]  locus=scaffold1089:58093:58248:- [translate_table: standard]